MPRLIDFNIVAGLNSVVSFIALQNVLSVAHFLGLGPQGWLKHPAMGLQLTVSSVSTQQLSPHVFFFAPLLFSVDCPCRGSAWLAVHVSPSPGQPLLSCGMSYSGYASVIAQVCHHHMVFSINM